MAFVQKLISSRRLRKVTHQDVHEYLDQQHEQQQQQQKHPLSQNFPKEFDPVPPTVTPLHVQQSIVDTIHIYLNRLEASFSSNTPSTRFDDIALFLRNEILLGRRLGTGGFSDVYEIDYILPESWNEKHLSFHQSLTRECLMNSVQAGNLEENGAAAAAASGRHVMKHLKLGMLKDKSRDQFCMAAAELIAEGIILASIQHPNIVKIRAWAMTGAHAYDDGRHDGYFLILDRIQETLSQRMLQWRRQQQQQQPLWSRLEPTTETCAEAVEQHWIECVRIGIQIASAMEYLHQHHWIFRDLKPDNIGFDAHGNVKIFDFGLCRQLQSNGVSSDTLSSMTGRVGTMVYMSPECALQLPYGVSSDVYSFSLVLFQMMNHGIHGFVGYSRDQYLEKVCQNGDRPVVNPSWPIMIIDLLERGWSANIEERPTMTEIKDRLEDVLLDLIQSNCDGSKRREDEISSNHVGGWKAIHNPASTMEFYQQSTKRPMLVLQE